MWDLCNSQCEIGRGSRDVEFDHFVMSSFIFGIVIFEEDVKSIEQTAAAFFDTD